MIIKDLGGELHGLVENENILSLPKAPVFTRSSLALKKDLQEIEINEPRIEYIGNWLKFIGKAWGEIL